ncbi:zinc-ribbon domain-containing protein [Microbacterium sp. CH-015]
MVRDNASLTERGHHQHAPIHVADDRETVGRASLYPATVAVLRLLSDATTVEGWCKLPPEALRGAIAADLPPLGCPVDTLIERIVLWLRPHRRKNKRTRCATLFKPLDAVDAAAIIDVTAPYPSWIRRNPAAIAEWAWGLCDPRTDPWEGHRISQTAVWACDEGHRWKTSPSVRGLSGSGCPYCAGQRVWPGHTDLRTTHPRIAAEWDGVRRNAGDPDHVAAKSNRRIHWRCRRGHRWEATIRERALDGAGCPCCDSTHTLAE